MSTPIDTSNAYKLWAPNYEPNSHNELMQVEERCLISMLPPVADAHVLDLACGTGRYGKYLHDQAKFVVGIDNSEHMIDAARTKFNISFPMVQAAMENIPLQSNLFDIVICGLATGHLPSDKLSQCFGEISRVLRVSGIVLISDFHYLRYQHGGRRTLRVNGIEYHIEHYIHELTEYLALGQTYLLKLLETKEAYISSSITEYPAILTMCFQKQESGSYVKR